MKNRNGLWMAGKWTYKKVHKIWRERMKTLAKNNGWSDKKCEWMKGKDYNEWRKGQMHKWRKEWKTESETKEIKEEKD